MPLPKQIDDTVKSALARSVSECAVVVHALERRADAPLVERHTGQINPFTGAPQTEVDMPPPADMGPFEKARQGVLTVLAFIGGDDSVIAETASRVVALKADLRGARALYGIIASVAESYEHGLFERIFTRIELAIAGDYLGQAEELLEEGQRGKSDHVPAAVLLGAVFEKKVRALCASRSPRVDVKTVDGSPKKIVVLIDELKKAGLYAETKAKELRWVASVRNHAAHGEFDKFTRADVEKMQVIVGQFVEEN